MTSPSCPFAPVPNHPVIRSLPHTAQLVLAKLYWHRNARTGQCNPRHETLARDLRCSLSTIERSIRLLREAGTISAIKRQRGNQYDIRPEPEWRRPVKKRPCGVSPDASAVKGQNPRILIERKTSLLNNKSTPPVKHVQCEGGGGDDQKHAGKERKNQTPNAANPEPKPEVRTVTPEAQALHQELYPKHPIVGNPSGALRAIANVLAQGATPEEIRASHERFRKLWKTYRQGRFIPMLARWIEENDWRYPPDDGQIAAATDPNVETPERKEREAQYRAVGFLEAIRKLHYLPDRIEREMRSHGFTPEEIQAELIQQGWRIAS